jgi:hypothetical protein
MSPSIIKDQSLIVESKSSNNQTEIVIKDGVWLGDVFTELPPGIFYKDETGMGATTLELNTKRNSIIVEPIKVTASSKAQLNDAIYVGSPTEVYPNKKSVKQLAAEIATKSGNIKIVVVADSLGKVVDALGESVFQDYFLMIDEADSFQLDSFFRSSMETAMDYYKQFLPEKRSLVTATPLAFSDPALKDEPVTYVRYQSPHKREINLKYTRSLLGSTADAILDKLRTHPNDKIVVSYNSVSGCFDLAEHLKNSALISDEEIKVLCSVASKSKVGKYYSELTGVMLPGKVNFMTSAYFTGFDIKEKFHQISVSSSRSRIYALSEMRFKQIAGRCRVGLHSETIIYDTVHDDDKNEGKVTEQYTVEQLISAAEKEIEALRCIQKSYENNAVLSHSFGKIRDLIISSTTTEGFSFVRKDKNGVPTIAYLNIDAYLESSRVQRELYVEKEALRVALEEGGHIIHYSEVRSATDVKKKEGEKESLETQVADVIAELELITNETELLNINIEYPSARQKLIIETFGALFRYVDRKQLLEKLALYGTKRNARELKKFENSAWFAALHDDEHFKREVYHQFELNSINTPTQIRDKWNAIFEDFGMHKVLTETQSVQLLNRYFVTKRKRKGSKADSRVIISSNPEKLKIINKRKYRNIEI